jgi:hypothetical protein
LQDDFAPSLRDSPHNSAFLYPTLKRGANQHCAYGAEYEQLPTWTGSIQVVQLSISAARIAGCPTLAAYFFCG